MRSSPENLLGEKAWASLEAKARIFIATGEKPFREHHADSGFDFAPVLGSFSKAMEVQVNELLRRAAPKLAPKERLANIDGATVDVTGRRALTLGQLAKAIGGERALNDGVRRVLEHGAWFAGSLPAILDELRPLRNQGTHHARVDRESAARWRNQLLGVGCMGHFVELAKVRRK